MYISYSDVIQRYPMLKTWSGNSPMLNDEITYAEQELNGRMAPNFTVPFSGSHPTVKDLAIDLTYYRAVRLRDPEVAEKFKEGILGRIEDIKAGKEYIYTDSNTTIAPDAALGEEIWCNLENYHPTMSMLNPSNPYSRISSERILDEENERV